jgi:hypothetical protein
MSAIRHMPPPVALFQGYNSVLGGGRSTAIEGTSANAGARSLVRCSVCSTATDLANSLEIDQSLSVGFGSVGSVDEKMKFFTSLQVTTYSISIVVYARHGIGTTTATSTRLKNSIPAPSTSSDLIDFVDAYGDSFLSAVTQGGEYYAVYTFFTETREEQTSFESSLKANGVYDGVSVAADLQTKLSNFLRTTTVRYRFQQEVSGILNPVLPEPGHIVSYAIGFPSLTIDSPVIIGRETTGYESVTGIGSDFASVAKNREYFVGASIMDSLTRDLVTISQIYNQMSWLKSVYDFYGGHTDDTLHQYMDTAKADIQSIHAQMEDYGRNPTQSFTKPALTSIGHGTPSLTYSVGTAPSPGQWGGNEGDPFDDVDVTAYIQARTRIAELQLRTGGRVTHLFTTYQSEGRTWQTSHGGDRGDLGDRLQLLPGQVITRVHGRSGGRVDQVNFDISDGRTVGGGGDGGDAFSWSPPAGHFVLGFHGRSAGELDRIAVHYASFGDAKWTPVDSSR